MAGSVKDEKMAHILALLDQNKDGWLGVDDAEAWVDRLAAIRQWSPGSDGYVRLENMLTDVMRNLVEDPAAVDGKLPLPALRDALYSFAEPGRPELGFWAAGFFQVLDADEEGIIGPDEYRDFMASVNVDSAVADETFVRLDLNGDGRLSRDEFAELYLEFFRSDDPEAPGSWLWGPWT